MKNKRLNISTWLTLMSQLALSAMNALAWPGGEADVTMESKWATYAGGLSAQGEQFRAATADADGNVYLVAVTEASSIPQTVNDRVPPNNNWSMYVARITPNGQIAWSRWIGETGGTADIAHDGLGNLCVAAGNFNPAAVEGLGERGGGAFVVKLNAATGDRQWSKYITQAPWNWWEGAEEVALTTGAAGQIYVVTDTVVDIFTSPVNSRPVVEAGAAPTLDACVVKMSPAGAVVWASYVGGRGADFPEDVAVDASGTIYVIPMERSLANKPPFSASSLEPVKDSGPRLRRRDASSPEGRWSSGRTASSGALRVKACYTAWT